MTRRGGASRQRPARYWPNDTQLLAEPLLTPMQANIANVIGARLSHERTTIQFDVEQLSCDLLHPKASGYPP
jgi:hypothetical protein